jgi:hypothetical protein
MQEEWHRDERKCTSVLLACDLLLLDLDIGDDDQPCVAVALPLHIPSPLRRHCTTVCRCSSAVNRILSPSRCRRAIDCHHPRPVHRLPPSRCAPPPHCRHRHAAAKLLPPSHCCAAATAAAAAAPPPSCRRRRAVALPPLLRCRQAAATKLPPMSRCCAAATAAPLPSCRRHCAVALPPPPQPPHSVLGYEILTNN